MAMPRTVALSVPLSDRGNGMALFDRHGHFDKAAFCNRGRFVDDLCAVRIDIIDNRSSGGSS
jgi:hypothetical protein